MVNRRKGEKKKIADIRLANVARLAGLITEDCGNVKLACQVQLQALP